MFELICHLVSVIVGAFAVPVVKKGAQGWTKLYTSFAPADERDDRRLQVMSHLADEEADCKSERYTPQETAVRMLFETLTGVPDDLAWARPFIIPTVAEKLTEWSDASGGFRPPEWLVKSVAILGFVNLGSWASGDYDDWSNVVVVNAAAPVVLAFVLHLDRPLARRALNAFAIVVAAVAIGGMSWAVFAFRLYDEPVLLHSLSQCALIFLPPVLIWDTRSLMQRTGVIEDRTWPIWAARTVIVVVSLFLSGHVGMSAWVLLAAWAAFAAALVLLISVMAGCLLAALAVCHAGTKSCSAGLNFVAASFRNRM